VEETGVERVSVAAECVICGGGCTEFLRRDGVPVQQNFLFPTRQEAVDAARGDLRFVVCERCGFIFNAAFDPALVPYGENYENDQTCSEAFRAYVDGIIRHLFAKIGPRSGHIVEVGCGQAGFLKQLLAEVSALHTATGFDPSYRGPESSLDGRLRVERRYYGRDCAVPADLVISRHVIEHVPRPLDFLAQIAASMETSPGAHFFCETPDVEWILRNEVFWDFFYEHCSLFTAQSSRTAFQLSGFEVQQVQYAFGGQYLWVDAAAGAGVTTHYEAGSIPSLAHAFGVRERQLKHRWTELLEAVSHKGKVAVWGAGAKGVTFVNLIDPLGSRVDCVVDLNPSKQGSFIAGTGHPIVDPRQLPDRGVRTAIVMNPNYIEENERLVRKARFELEFIPAQA